MRDGFLLERGEKSRGDLVLLALVFLLLGTGLAVLFSSSYYYGARTFQDPYHFLKSQVTYAVLGTIAAYAAYIIPLELVRRLVPLALLVTIILLVMTFFSTEINQARRWIVIGGRTFQPSELAKLTLVLYLASIFAKKQGRESDLINTILPPALVTLLIVGLVYLQNDFSSAIFISLLALALFYMARVPAGYFIFLISAVIPLSLILLFTKEHRVQRLITFLDPSRDPVGASFQINAAKTALQRGGILGTGIGFGTKKLGGLPEAHSDFIFAVIGEELGFIGALLVFGLFLACAVRGYMIAFNSQEPFYQYLGFGLTTSIVYQAMFNLAVVTGLVPATGIPMPFYSSGGSSLIITLIMCGLLMNLSRARGQNE